MLVKKNKRWSLHFPFEKSITLPEKEFIRPVLAVDLGLTTTAVCSVVSAEGTVTHREFITYGGEKDRLNDILGRIAVKSGQTCLITEGERFCANDWRVVHHLTEEIAHGCSTAIVRLAVRYNCQAIVFEHLGKLRIPKGFYGAKRLRRKVHYWLQGRIQKYTKYKAHASSIRFSRVLARGTSQYAYDGSGKVHRTGNQQIAVFSGGQKIYNADLNASYNIAARYWIREYVRNAKSLGRNAQVVLRDQSSFLAVRHLQVLASLISLVRLLPRKRSARALYPSQRCSQKETLAITASPV
jgi:IS605 OrfB family transposase